MKPMMLLALVATALTLTACNTVSGLGRDITATSETVRSWF